MLPWYQPCVRVALLELGWSSSASTATDPCKGLKEQGLANFCSLSRGGIVHLNVGIMTFNDRNDISCR